MPGTYADPVVLDLSPGVHTANIAWNNTEPWGPGNGIYRLCVFKAESTADVTGIQWTPITAPYWLELSVQYERIDGWPNDWYYNDAWSWNMDTTTYPILDTIYNEMPVYFLLVDWGSDPGGTIYPGGTIEYETFRPAVGTPLPGNGLKWKISQQVPLVLNHDVLINIGNEVIPLPGSTRAIVVTRSYNKCNAALIDTTSSGIIIDEKVVMDPGVNMINFSRCRLVKDRIFLGFRFSSLPPQWRRIGVDGDSLTITDVTSDPPTAFTNSNGDPNDNMNWVYLSGTTYRGIQEQGYQYRPRVVEVDYDGKVISQGSSIAAPGPGQWNCWSDFQVTEDPNRFWMTWDNYDNVTLPDRFGIGRIRIDGMNIYNDTNVIPENEATWDTTNSGVLMAITTDLAVNLYDRNDARFDDSATWGGYAGLWADLYQAQGSSVVRIDRRQIYVPYNEVWVHNDYQDVNFQNSEMYTMWGEGAVGGSGLFVIAEKQEPTPMQDPFGSSSIVETHQYISITASTTGIIRGSVYEQPTGTAVQWSGSAPHQAVVGNMVVTAHYESTTQNRVVTVWQSEMANLDGALREARKAFWRPPPYLGGDS